MNEPQGLQSPKHLNATYAGLFLALFGLPIFAAGFRLITGDNHSDLQMIIRELCIFALVGLLFWIVKKKEGLPLRTIGLSADRLGRSALWGVALGVVSLVVTIGLYLLFQQFGIKLGSGDGHSFQPSLWVVSLSMLRAGVAEEIFYRGYAIERLKSLGGGMWASALVPLVLFAAAHYRQGIGGVCAALILGGIFTIFYMKRRDLIASITGHFLADFVLNVGLPLLDT